MKQRNRIEPEKTVVFGAERTLGTMDVCMPTPQQDLDLTAGWLKQGSPNNSRVRGKESLGVRLLCKENRVSERVTEILGSTNEK